MVFVATAGEERGFLGARQLLADNDCKGGIAAVLNLDWFGELGRTAQLASHGLGYTSLDSLVARLARAQGREVTARDAYFAGGDRLPFIFAGIPAFHGGLWGTSLDRPAGFEEDYTQRRNAGAVLREGNSNRDEPCWTVDTGFAAPGRRCSQ